MSTIKDTTTENEEMEGRGLEGSDWAPEPQPRDASGQLIPTPDAPDLPTYEAGTVPQPSGQFPEEAPLTDEVGVALAYNEAQADTVPLDQPNANTLQANQAPFVIPHTPRATTPRPNVRAYVSPIHLARGTAGAICVGIGQAFPLLATDSPREALHFAANLADQNGVSVDVEPGEANGRELRLTDEPLDPKNVATTITPDSLRALLGPISPTSQLSPADLPGESPAIDAAPSTGQQLINLVMVYDGETGDVSEGPVEVLTRLLGELNDRRAANPSAKYALPSRYWGYKDAEAFKKCAEDLAQSASEWPKELEPEPTKDNPDQATEAEKEAARAAILEARDDQAQEGQAPTAGDPPASAKPAAPKKSKTQTK